MKKHLAILSFVVFGFSFLFVRVYNSGPVFFTPTGGDDGGYLAYTSVFLKTHSFDWCHPNMIYNHSFSNQCASKKGKVYNPYTPGSALLLLPFTLAGTMVEQLGLAPEGIHELRFFSIVGTYALFLLSAFIIYLFTFRLLDHASLSLFTTVAFLMGNIILYYVFRRPLMAHAAEFFVLSCILYVFSFPRFQDFSFTLGLLLGLLVLVRLNDILFVGVILAFIVFARDHWRRKIKNFLMLVAGGTGPLVFFLGVNYSQTGSLVYEVGNYSSNFTLGDMFTPSLYSLRRIWDFFFGPHWGIALLMPIFFVELFFIGKKLNKLITKRNFLSVAASSFFIFLIFLMRANLGTGGSYAYRLLILPYFCVHFVFLLALRNCSIPLKIPKGWLWAIATCCLIASLHLLNFETNSKTLTLTPQDETLEGIFVEKHKGQKKIVAPNYALHSFKNMFTGKALANLGAAPIVAYPLLATQDLIGSLPGVKTALSFYHSEKRRVFTLWDLKILFQYHVWILLFTLIIFFGFSFLMADPFFSKNQEQ